MQGHTDSGAEYDDNFQSYSHVAVALGVIGVFITTLVKVNIERDQAQRKRFIVRVVSDESKDGSPTWEDVQGKFWSAVKCGDNFNKFILIDENSEGQERSDWRRYKGTDELSQIPRVLIKLSGGSDHSICVKKGWCGHHKRKFISALRGPELSMVKSLIPLMFGSLTSAAIAMGIRQSHYNEALVAGLIANALIVDGICVGVGVYYLVLIMFAFYLVEYGGCKFSSDKLKDLIEDSLVGEIQNGEVLCGQEAAETDVEMQSKRSSTSASISSRQNLESLVTQLRDSIESAVQIFKHRALDQIWQELQCTEGALQHIQEQLDQTWQEPQSSEGAFQQINHHLSQTRQELHSAMGALQQVIQQLGLN